MAEAPCRDPRASLSPVRSLALTATFRTHLAPAPARAPARRAPACTPSFPAPISGFCVGSRYLYVAEHTHLTRTHTDPGVWRCSAGDARTGCRASRIAPRPLTRAHPRGAPLGAPSYPVISRVLCAFALFVCGRAHTFDANPHKCGGFGVFRGDERMRAGAGRGPR